MSYVSTISSQQASTPVSEYPPKSKTIITVGLVVGLILAGLAPFLFRYGMIGGGTMGGMIGCGVILTLLYAYGNRHKCLQKKDQPKLEVSSESKVNHLSPSKRVIRAVFPVFEESSPALRQMLENPHIQNILAGLYPFEDNRTLTQSKKTVLLYHVTISPLLDERLKVQFIKALIQESADPNDFEDPKTGRTPLHEVAKEGSIAAIQALIDRGADRQAKDHLERTPLYLAADAGRMEAVKLFLEKDKSENLQISYIPHFFQVVRNGNIPLVQLFLPSDLNSTKSEENGWTALHFAGFAKNKELYDFLVSVGASETIPDRKGKTPGYFLNHKKEEEFDFNKFFGVSSF